MRQSFTNITRNNETIGIKAEERVEFMTEKIREYNAPNGTVVDEQVMGIPLTVEKRAKEIANFIRDNYGKYDNVPVKEKSELFQFSVDDLNADMKLHSLVLKELNVKMYSSELYDDYMSVVDTMKKKQSDELQKVDYHSNEKRWNRGR